MQARDKPGRGLKQCMNCNKYVGVRNKFCPSCNNPFEQSVARRNRGQEIAYIPERKKPVKSRYQRILTPSGYCPVKLKELDKDSIVYWAQNVQALGFEEGQHYLASALRYFMRQFIDPLTQEYRLASSYITEEEFN